MRWTEDKASSLLLAGPQTITINARESAKACPEEGDGDCSESSAIPSLQTLKLEPR